MKSAFFILECNELKGFKDMEVRGPFTSEEACKRNILDEAKSNYIPASEDLRRGGRITNWGSNTLVVQVVSTWKPVPVLPEVPMNVRMDLELSEQKGTYVK
jgi:hypothetical protein